MLYDSWFKNPGDISPLLEKIRKYSSQTGPVRLMEICGTHTMSIARSGIRSILPPDIQLLSGPGCPVCVTPQNMIDMILELSVQSDVIITSYGDLLRVPGSRRGDSLLSRRGAGADIRSVYSPADAVRIAQDHPEKEVIFLGVGFETTAPGTAACILDAADQNIKNFSVLSMLKRTEPALRALIESDDFAVDGFLCPGHVAAITGVSGFRFLADDYHLPGVIAGFEPADLLYSILVLTRMISERRPALKNEYTRLVRPEGNRAAMQLTNQVFTVVSSDWRGLGQISNSGYRIREKYAPWDARRKFHLCPPGTSDIPGCRCAQVIRGVLSPENCPLFKTACTPENPVGPCMVSGEGACSAAFQYGE